MPGSRQRRRNLVGLVLLVLLLGSVALLWGSNRDRDIEEVLERVAFSSGIHSGMDVNAAGTHLAYTTEYGEPALVVIPTAGDAEPQRFTFDDMWPRRPLLSPDGRQVLFEAQRDDARSVASRIDGIWLLDVETGDSRQIVQPAGRAFEEVSWPAWAPDSRRIAYVRAWKEDTWRFTMHVLDLSTGDDRIVVPDERLPVRAPAWSPDGRHLAYIGEPDMWITRPDGSDRRKLTSMPGAENAPSTTFPDAPAWSPDGSVLAYSARVDECYQIRMLELGSGHERVLDDECAMRPTWIDSGERLAYLRLGDSSRTLWERSIAGESPRLLGFEDGLIYRAAPAADGSILVVGQPSDQPRAIWRIRRDGDRALPPEPLVSTFDPPLESRFISAPETVLVRSEDGVEVPVQVFPRVCGRADAPGPALVWVHGGPHEDVAPRWYQEIQLLTLHGVTVFAVNYRGSTGNGAAFRAMSGDHAGQIADVRAAIELARTRPDVDPDQVFLLGVCWASNLIYDALLADPASIAGVVDWIGVSAPPRQPATLAERLPPMLWVTGKYERNAGWRGDLAERLGRAGLEIEHIMYDAGHSLLDGRDRGETWLRVGRFLARHSEYTCEGPR
jgi:dipeptidyl aminopeptidase/acylaminoacyl peptidase